MSRAVSVDDSLVIPACPHGLDDFRRWALSDDFPDRGRIDFIDGQIEVDMSPEDLFTHSKVKTRLAVTLGQIVIGEELGELFIDRARVSSGRGGLSTEPDLVFVSRDAIASGAVRLVPKASDPDRFVELEGAATLVVEIVSDASVAKDTRRAPPAHFAAGTGEYWLVDARGEELSFQIFTRGASQFEPVAADDEGFLPSPVLARVFRLRRHRGALNFWQYDLDVKPS